MSNATSAHTPHDAHHVCVVGAGIAGLTAAWHLMQRGHEVTVLEASDHVGGMIKSVREDGYLLDLGPNTVPDRRGALAALIEGLGLTDRIMRPNQSAKKRFIVRDGKMVAIPTSAAAFASSPFLSGAAKLRLAAEVLTLRRPEEEADEVDESLANFIRRHFGDEVLEYGVNPLIAGTYGGQPQHLSAKHVFGRVQALEQETGSIILGALTRALRARQGANEDDSRGTPGSGELVNFDEGEQVLTDALKRALGKRIQTRSPVEVATYDKGQWHVLWRKGARRTKKTETFDAIVCAIPAHRVGSIQWCYKTQHVNTSIFDEITHPPIANVFTAFKREDVRHPLDGFGVLIPEVEEREILGTVFNSSVFKGRAPKDEVLMLSFLGGARQPEQALLSEAQRQAAVLRELGALVGISGAPTMVRHMQWTHSIPQYEVGYDRILQGIARIEDNMPDLWFTGNYRAGISVSDTAYHGEHVARAIHERASARQNLFTRPPHAASTPEATSSKKDL